MKDKRKKGRGTDKNLDGDESEEAEIEEVNFFPLLAEKMNIFDNQ